MWAFLYIFHSSLELICCWLLSTIVSPKSEAVSRISSRLGWVQLLWWHFNPDCYLRFLLQISQRYRVSFFHFPVGKFSVCDSVNTLLALLYSLGRQLSSKQRKDVVVVFSNVFLLFFILLKNLLDQWYYQNWFLN